MEKKIDFFIIGAQKSGTTTLYYWLKQHPDIFLPDVKEILYFADDELFIQGHHYLDVFYKDYNNQRIAGLAYVMMMYYPHAANRIYQYNPKAKLIILLRNPIDRAYSSYWFAIRNGLEKSKSFDEIIAKKMEQSSVGFSEKDPSLAYLSHGHYADQLQPFLKVFGRDNVHVILTEELKNNAVKKLETTLQFLGVEFKSKMIDVSVVRNEAALPHNYFLHRLLLSHGSWYKKLGRKMLSPNKKDFIRRYVTSKIIALNLTYDIFER